ncbi:hypothetical protein [Streptomyces sp. NPDC060065]|uniref:hypothetical protein n=1 Tax=Streptomyces sp. NPDC060065 TaxID=3347050 RepID=UPI0036972014
MRIAAANSWRVIWLRPSVASESDRRGRTDVMRAAYDELRSSAAPGDYLHHRAEPGDTFGERVAILSRPQETTAANQWSALDIIEQ